MCFFRPFRIYTNCTVIQLKCGRSYKIGCCRHFGMFVVMWCVVLYCLIFIKVEQTRIRGNVLMKRFRRNLSWWPGNFKYYPSTIAVRKTVWFASSCCLAHTRATNSPFNLEYFSSHPVLTAKCKVQISNIYGHAIKVDVQHLSVCNHIFLKKKNRGRSGFYSILCDRFDWIDGRSK